MIHDELSILVKAVKTHAIEIGFFEFSKEIFAIIGVVWVLYSLINIFFSLLIWSKPNQTQVKQ